jgi:hypothetical protein
MRSIKEYAEELGIPLMSILPRATDPLQPLDRVGFRARKAMCRRLFRRHIADDPMMAVNHQIADVQFLITCWEQVGLSVLTRAWSLYLNPAEEEEREFKGS